MKNYSYILLDAANTLIHKPQLWNNLTGVLKEYNHDISRTELIHKHKLVSELISFPDVTNEEFYNKFNVELLHSLGIVPEKKLLNAIFLACKNLPWKAYDDVTSLHTIKVPIGVLSNFSLKLPTILNETMGDLKFKHIFVSEAFGVAKPSQQFFHKAIDEIGLLPHEILYVGDSMKLDIVPALSLGMHVKLIDREMTYPSSTFRIQSLKTLNY
jgi:FMN phosphatase YigB (HAD superfamily)